MFSHTQNSETPKDNFFEIRLCKIRCKNEAAEVKYYQVVGYFQVQSRQSVAFLRDEIQLSISKIIIWILSKRFFIMKVWKR